MEKMIQFEQNGKKFIYDFNKLCGSQIIMAEQAFIISGQKLNKEPNNVTEMENIISQTALFKAFGILLLELGADGEIIPFNEDQEKGINFVKSMNAENTVKLYNGISKEVDGEKIVESEGVQKDFFINLKRPSPESQRLSKDLMNMMKEQQLNLGSNMKETMQNVQNLLKTLKKNKESS
jgi:hypothetical protein